MPATRPSQAESVT